MESSQATRYTRFQRIILLSAFFVPAGLLYFFQKLDWSSSFSQYSLHLARSYYAGLLFYWSVVHLGLTLALLAINAAAYGLDRHYKLARQSYRSWLGDYFKRRLINWLVTSIGVLWFYSAVRYSPERWHLLFWPAIILFYAAVLLLLDSVFLPFFFKVVPLESGEIFERLSSLAARAGISRPKFAVVQVGHKTARSNALVTGVAGRYRILITDTVLATFTAEEIEAVVAHEIGHQVKHHTTTRLLFLAGIYYVPLWGAHLVLPDLVSDLPNFAYLPYLFIFMWVVSLYMSIASGVFTRAQETAADRFGWKLTGNVSAFVSMMRKLAEQNLMPTKRVLASHPAVEARIQAAEKFLQQQQPAASAASAGPSA